MYIILAALLSMAATFALGYVATPTAAYLTLCIVVAIVFGVLGGILQALAR